MAQPYDFKAIEDKWLPRWEAAKAWAAPRLPEREKRYVLEMYPYPSGDMHMGHVENYSIGDAFARYWKMQGFDVLHPFGYDAFGLPAENKAIELGLHPRESTYANIERFTNSCKNLAFFYDWDRCQITCDPAYYKWNQWLFLRLFEKGLAYRGTAKVNWCPVDKTVLANEQVQNGVCWRCGSVPVVRDLDQWFFKTTEYSQRLLDDMDQLEWGDAVLTQQRNWIGRSEGARVRFTIKETSDEIEIFTTRPDTLYGVTFFVFAAEHPVAAALAERAGKGDDFRVFVDEVRRATDIERLATQRERKAFDLHAHAVNPLNGEEIPVFASDYVLMEYGTGAIMAVPAHDQRDFEFAQQLGLPIRTVIVTDDAEGSGGAGGEAAGAPAIEQAFEGEGVMVASGPFDGLRSDEGRAAVIEHLQDQGLGFGEVQFRLRDWLISRQRYWGTPIPVVYCDTDGIVTVPDSELPIELPTDADYHLTEDAVSPLAKATDWLNTACPKCGGPAKRETDTMDTFVDSSWYFLRFCDPHNDDAPFDTELVDAWMAVDQYTGGIEHAVMHLIYARFVTKFLHDIGMVAVTEPFARLLNHGTINMEGKRMSKSRGNVVEPGEVLDMFGADALRLHMLFINPPDAPYDWPPEGGRACVGSYRFLSDVWKLVVDHLEELRGEGAASGSSELRRFVHQKLRAITEDYERWSYNTAVSKLMELRTELQRASKAGADAADVREGVDVLLHCLAPFCPYITQELWERLGGEGSIHERSWPAFDAQLAVVEKTTMVVQVDSRVRDKIEVAADISEADAIALARTSERAAKFLDGEPKRVIARPPKLVNLLTK